MQVVFEVMDLYDIPREDRLPLITDIKTMAHYYLKYVDEKHDNKKGE
jgi:hypothetical protein